MDKILPNDSGQKRVNFVRFQVLTAASMQMAAFWVVSPCSLVEDYWHLKGASCLHHQSNDHPDNGGSKHLWNVSQLRYRMSLTSERPTYEHLHLWTGERCALTQTCEQLFMLQTWVSSTKQTTYERKFGTQPVRKLGTPCTEVWLIMEGDDHPDDGGSKHLWNVSKLLPYYIAQQPRRQPSSR
jgi:hypothetical protein